ncbi:MAG: NUDIX hydrolase [Steroidobacteraceae bacterium]|jgi:8-oxo-dGTP pyrophosphatase MutT (NUDIX family)
MPLESDRAAAAVSFFDRRGNQSVPRADSIVKPRRGVFALVVALTDQAIMLAAEACAPDVPELPGGGIEAGETLDEAIAREWAEEVGIAFDVQGPFERFQHVRGFHADDRDEFWIYDQTFLLYHFTGRVNAGRKWSNSEGGIAGWVEIATLPKLTINRAHWCAIPALLATALPPQSGVR